MQELTYEIARQRENDLRRVTGSHRQSTRGRASIPEQIVIRLAETCDSAALHRLAALEGVDLATGSWLCAETDGTLTAALHLDDGVVLADPFARTSAVRQTLELWASQVGGRRRRRWRLALQ